MFSFRSLAYGAVYCALLLIGYSSSLHAEPPAQPPPTIPAQADWIECGAVFAAGAEGEWDRYLWGGFANGIVKRNGTYYLYYQGASGYDDAEETVTWRALGVATSTDGLHFTKYDNNPVLRWFPNNQLEEGAVSSGVFVDTSGETALYYGANTWAGGSFVHADGRLATSPDGFSFTDLGVVLNHASSAVWGWGDEIYPIIGLQEAGRWVSYYIPGGSAQRGQLGVAWGSSRDALSNTAAATAGSSPVAVWGSGSAVRLGEGVYALFLNNIRAPGGPVMDVHTVSLSAPASLSAPLQRYQFDNVQQAQVLLDEETGRWLMYYRNTDGNSYGLKVARLDGQPPSCSPPPTPTDTPTPTGSGTIPPLPTYTPTPAGSGTIPPLPTSTPPYCSGTIPAATAPDCRQPELHLPLIRTD